MFDGIKKLFGKGEDGELPPESTAFAVKWLAELEKAKKREKKYRKVAREVEKIYEPEGEDEVPFNILYSNTETLLPALYNNTPRPVVSRRYKSPDDLAAMGARVLESFLTYQIDTNGRDYTAFDDLIKFAVLQALVPGRGISWFKYDPKFEKLKDAEGQEYDSLTAEQVCWEEVPWDSFLTGYARKWESIPWVARILFMTKDEVKKNFGEEYLLEVKFNTASEGADDDRDDPRPDDSRQANLATVYEIWDKVTKKVIFLAEGSKVPLRVVDDPLKLSGFFPCPKPLQFYERNKTLIPIPLYQAYRNQAEELNRITKRISALTQMLKVRGFYDGSVQNIGQVLQGEDGILIAADNVAAMMQGQTLQNSVWLFPLETIINVLQQLHVQREAVKRTIYEITGIADIMRGSSVASETLGAQEIKNQWGTLRLKRMQKSVMLYVRESLRITVEIASMQFSPETFASITGFDLPTAEMKQQMQMQMQTAVQQGMQVPPEIQAQVQSFSKTPTWDDIINFFRNDPMRQYRIDIETNSTVDIEATEDKQQVGEFLNAIAQFLNGIAPIVEGGMLPPEAAKTIMTAVVRRFRFGVEVEESLNKMTAPKPPESKEQAPAQAPQPTQAEMAAEQTKLGTEQLKQATLKMEFDLAQAEHAYKMEELALKRKVLLAQAEKSAADLAKPKEAPSASV